MTTDSCCCPQNPSGSPAPFLRERSLIILLSAFLVCGVFFMLIPGTLIGVLNLIEIGNKQSSSAAALAWIQAHGHAQLFGWIGTFILGLGFYSIPNLRKLCGKNFLEGWVCLLLWTIGVALRWLAVTTSYAWQWLLPISALAELAAVAYFVHLSVKGTRLSKSGKKLEGWSVLLVSGTMFWLLLMLVNLGIVLNILPNSEPLIPLIAGRKFLFASVWSFIVPIVWGLSARWLPALLKLRETNQSLLKLSALLNPLACIGYACGLPVIPELTVLASTVLYVSGLKLFSKANQAESAKETASFPVFPTFPIFVRTAYGWLFAASILFLAAAIFPDASGTAGAARHAITVGFLSTMVFTIGPRILPAFLGRKHGLYYPAVIAALIFLSFGCFLRVSSQIFAYDFAINAFWNVLPVSAVIELTAMTVFCLNLLFSFRETPAVDNIIAAYSKNDKAGKLAPQ